MLAVLVKSLFLEMTLDSPKTFKMSPDGLRVFRNRYLSIFLPLYLIIFGAITLVQFSGREIHNFGAVVFSISGGIVIVTAISIFSYFRGKALLESYTIIWDTLTITRQQKDTPDLVLYHGEIKRVEFPKKGGMVVRGGNARDFILIPKRLEGFEELEGLLGQVASFAPYSPPAALRGEAFVHLISAVTFLAAIMVKDREWFYIMAILAVVFNIFSLILQSRNKNTSGSSRAFRLVRILFILFLLAKIYMDWSGLRFPQF